MGCSSPEMHLNQLTYSHSLYLWPRVCVRCARQALVNWTSQHLQLIFIIIIVVAVVAVTRWGAHVLSTRAHFHFQIYSQPFFTRRRTHRANPQPSLECIVFRALNAARTFVHDFMRCDPFRSQSVPSTFFAKRLQSPYPTEHTRWTQFVGVIGCRLSCWC